MTHASIIAHLYSHFSAYLGLWNEKVKGTDEYGAFVFLPENGLEWEWWNTLKIREYILEGGLDDEDILEGIKDVEPSAEFLVLVIQHVGGSSTQKAHFHRMSKARMN